MIATDSLSREIENALKEYTEEVEVALESTKKDLAKQGIRELKAISPVRTGKYAKSWTRKKRGKKIILHNKEYQLTHLLEKGHAKRDGGRVAARVHIAPVEKHLQQDAEQVFKKKLR